MLWSASDVFETVAPSVQTLIAGDAQLDACRRVARCLPKVTESYYLECRLDADEQVDFLTLVRRLPVAVQFNRRSPAVESSRWQRTLEFFDRWQESSSALRKTPFVWLEYDLNGLDDAVPAPSPGFCLEVDYLARFSQAPEPDPELALEMGTAGLHCLTDSSTRTAAIEGFERCLRVLPAGGSIIHVSVMLGRSPSVLKLYVAVPKRDVAAYLAEIGWSGDEGAVRRILETSYAKIESTVFMDLTIDDQVGSRLGFAFSQFHRREMEKFDPAWRHLPMQDAIPAKRRAVEAWPGVTETCIGGLRTWVHRWLDLKLVLEASGAVRHKAYLGFMPALPAPFA